jgi:hypothetical protein
VKKVKVKKEKLTMETMEIMEKKKFGLQRTASHTLLSLIVSSRELVVLETTIITTRSTRSCAYSP